jgi:hypothetical protein
MAIEIGKAHEVVLAAIAGGARDAVVVTPITSLPGAAYGFDPSGWLLFNVHRRNDFRVGGDEYVAVHSESGEFRHLGLIGE